MDQKQIERLEKLEKSCREYISDLRKRIVHKDDQQNYKNDIYEKAMEFFFGENIWDEINELFDLQEDQ